MPAPDPLPAPGRDARRLALPASLTPEGERLLAAALALAGGAKAANTLRAYAADCRDWWAFCGRSGFPALPASPAALAAFVADLGHRGARISTIRRRLQAVAWLSRGHGHPVDLRDPLVADATAGLARQAGSAQRQAAALTLPEIRALAAACGHDLAGQRDRALLLLGFAGALRRSELLALDVERGTESEDLARSWIEITADGLALRLAASKGDRAREGVRLGIPRGRHPATCPVRAVEAWIAAAGLRYGPLFRPVSRWGAVEPGRHPGHPARAGQPARAARGLHHRGLSPGSRRRGDHGPFPPPPPRQHAPLRPPRETRSPGSVRQRGGIC
ncbi:site-specific integrase [Paracraurococcus lichenis]|uniref:Integrase n=1 Tax=Paracraurococcus lichenis TaxID=3064888 RepID=A0ABT9EC48_9PROT|nr:integrase [Paracraurococcus sp. LOR1-02]MDO9713543.1 integrase [Paracraurococcus sp. LOR1-02]